MKEWAGGLLEEVGQLENEHEVFQKIEAAARALGFDNCAYGLRVPLPVTRPRIVMLNNYSLSWQARYADAGYVSVDPTVQHGRRSQIPLIWSDEIFVEVPHLWDEARSQGLCVGWAQSSLDGQGVSGMLTLVRSGEALTDLELAEKELKMRWLVNIAHLNLARVLAPQLHMALDVPLTPREVEIMKWHADGKTCSQISEILTISVDTVKFHTKNAIVKLGAANKTAAVVRAVMLGLLN